MIQNPAMELNSVFKLSIMQLEPENSQRNLFVTQLGRLITLHTKVVARVCGSIIKTILCFNFQKLSTMIINSVGLDQTWAQSRHRGLEGEISRRLISICSPQRLQKPNSPSPIRCNAALILSNSNSRRRSCSNAISCYWIASILDKRPC